MIKKKRVFFPEIEALRAIAVTMVMLAHFIPKESEYYVPYLWYGVDLFFTISGFLITYILIEQIHGPNQKPVRVLLKNFFVRRVLRLFPLYYTFVISFFLLRNLFSLHIWNNDFNFYFFTYLQNMFFFYQGEFNTAFSHLWSLGVEEQFYLVWPFILIIFPSKRLIKVFSFLILLSIVLNVGFQPEIKLFRALTIANLHTLGGGALLAYLVYFKQEMKYYQWIEQRRFLLFMLSFSLLLLSLNVAIPNYPKILGVEFFLMLTALMAVWLSVKGWPKALGFIFSTSIVHHIGKVSYGIYLFHMVIPAVLTVVISKIPMVQFLLPNQLILKVPLLILYSYGLATLSYHFFEVRFLKLKVRFA